MTAFTCQHAFSHEVKLIQIIYMFWEILLLTFRYKLQPVLSFRGKTSRKSISGVLGRCILLPRGWTREWRHQRNGCYNSSKTPWVIPPLYFPLPLNCFLRSTLCFPIFYCTATSLPPSAKRRLSCHFLLPSHNRRFDLNFVEKPVVMLCVWRLISTNTKKHRSPVPSRGTPITW